jgi:hypothetical protein
MMTTRRNEIYGNSTYGILNDPHYSLITWVMLCGDRERLEEALRMEKA